MKVLAVILSSALLLILLPGRVVAVEYTEIKVAPSKVVSINKGTLESPPTHSLGNINDSLSQSLFYFENIQIPKGSYVLNAELILTIESSTERNVNANITVAETLNSEIPEDYKDFLEINNAFMNNINWNRIPLGLEGTVIKSPDISRLVQRNVMGGNWSNKILISLTDNGSGLNSYINYYADSFSPKLRIKFVKPTVLDLTTQNLPNHNKTNPQIIPTPTPQKQQNNEQEVQGQITSSDDKVLTRSSIVSRVSRGGISDSTVSNSKYESVASIQSFGKDSYGSVENAILFEDIPVEKGKMIKSAFITFTLSGTSGEKVNVNISALNDSNPTAPSTLEDFDLLKENLTTAKIRWSNLPEGKWGTPLTTPDVATILQEVVDRDDWKKGSPMLFYFADNNSGQWSDRTFLTGDFEGTDGKPTLVIEYEEEYIPDATSAPVTGENAEKDPFDLTLILTPILKEE